MREGKSAEETEVREPLMPGVEQPQLHMLVGLHIVDDLDAGVFVGRTSGGEIVFEHPLEEGLGDDRPGIGDSRVGQQVGPVTIGRGRGDAVDHRIRESHCLTDPLGEFGIDEAGEGREHLRRHFTVLGDVVTRLHGERSDSGFTPGPQGRDDVSEDGRRQLTGAQGLDIGDDRRLVGDELSGDGVDVVPALGDGQ